MEDRVIAGRYQLRQRIGTGGMADVFLATDTRLARDVAIKILRPEHAADAAFVERFRREARAAASVAHPNIVAIYDTGPDDASGTYYIVMEHVPRTLKDVLARRSYLPEKDAIAIASPILGALHAAHQHGVIHRDLKPQNVLMTDDGKPKVADFGIARALGQSSLTTTSTVLGTAHYLSPEQAQGKDVDARADIYGMGVLLFELLTGTVPFRGDSAVSIAMQHTNTAPPLVRSIRPEISPQVEAVVAKALAKRPDARYPSAAAMRQALESAVATPRVTQAPAPSVLAQAAGAATAVMTAPPRGAVPSYRASDPRPSRAVAARRRGVPLGLVALLAVPLLAGSIAVATRLPTRAAPRPPLPAAVAVSTSTPTPEPTRTAAAVATPTAPARTAAPTPPPAAAPTAAPTAAQSQLAPATAVTSFYQLVSQKRFRDAEALWTAGMRASCPPADCLDGRFADTSELTLRAANTLEQTGTAATVAVDLREVRGGATYRFVGNWYLVRSGSGWLLNAQDLRPG